MICGVSKIGIYIRLIDKTTGGIGNRADETPQSLCDSSPINKQGSRWGEEAMRLLGDEAMRRLGD
jgi:hypothetical protein